MKNPTKRLTVIEFDNGFFLPLKEIFPSEGGFLKQELLSMADGLSLDTIEVRVLKVDKILSAEEFFSEISDS